MIQNILYLHGFNSNKDSYTGNTLKALFPQYYWILETFDLLDVIETKQQLLRIIKEQKVDTIVSSSLGAVYNLFLKKRRDQQPMVNKVLINPCFFPSLEVLTKIETYPTLKYDLCNAMEFNIFHRHKENTPDKLFGIFATHDERMHYHDMFVKLYGNKEVENAIWVEGGHQHLSESVLKDGLQMAFAYFEKMENERMSDEKVVQNLNWADPTKPYHRPVDQKPIVYFDMDGTMVDFESAKSRLDPVTSIKYNGCIDEAPHIFSMMDPMPGAVEAYRLLSKYYDVYVLTTAPWDNETACDDKKRWLKQHFGALADSPVYKRLFITHRKDMVVGDFLIDDRPTKCGVDHFSGTVIPFGPKYGAFPDWNSVLRYLLSDIID